MGVREPKPVDRCKGGCSYMWGSITFKLPTVVFVLPLSLLIFRTIFDDLNSKREQRQKVCPVPRLKDLVRGSALCVIRDTLN